MFQDKIDGFSRVKKSPYRDTFPRTATKPFFSFNQRYWWPCHIWCNSERQFCHRICHRMPDFVTAATNRPCNSLIINYAYRVQKSPWKVHDFLHREIKVWYSIGYILAKAWDRNLKLVETYSLQSLIRLYPWFRDYGWISLISASFVTVFVTKSPYVTEFCRTSPKKLPRRPFYEMFTENSHE